MTLQDDGVSLASLSKSNNLEGLDQKARATPIKNQEKLKKSVQYGFHILFYFIDQVSWSMVFDSPSHEYRQPVIF